MRLWGVPHLQRVGRVVETHMARTTERVVGLVDKGARLGRVSMPNELMPNGAYDRPHASVCADCYEPTRFLPGIRGRSHAGDRDAVEMEMAPIDPTHELDRFHSQLERENAPMDITVNDELFDFISDQL